MTKQKTIIDVSGHNGLIDWFKVKQSGIDGAIIRCGFGRNYRNQDDKRYKTNVNLAKLAGVPFGVYLYSYANDRDSVKSEVKHILRLTEGLDLALPLFYDMEQPGLEAKALEHAWYFIDAVMEAGYVPGIYASEYWFTHYLTSLDSIAWKWVAKYSKTKPRVSSLDMWQYTSSASIAGANGDVDLSYLYRDFLVTIDQLAHEVIAGKWGNGMARWEAIAQAGYDYAKVQAMVNELMGGRKRT